MHDFGGDGPDVVLAHAAGLHGAVWAPIAGLLRPYLRCVALDFRGHGSSGRPRRWDHNWEGLGLDVHAVLDGVGLREPAAAGHSSGGSAILLAEQARPGTFRALYCFEPVIVPAVAPLGRDSDNWLAERTRRRRDRFASPEEARAHFGHRQPYSTWCAEALDAYVAHGLARSEDGSFRLRCRPLDEAALYETASAHDAYNRLSGVGCPLTVVRGERSEDFSEVTARAVHSSLATTAVQALPNLGHFGPLEDPVAVAQSILRHLVPSAGASGPFLEERHV